jgi:hypothetical protein
MLRPKRMGIMRLRSHIANRAQGTGEETSHGACCHPRHKNERQIRIVTQAEPFTNASSAKTEERELLRRISMRLSAFGRGHETG